MKTQGKCNCHDCVEVKSNNQLTVTSGDTLNGFVKHIIVSYDRVYLKNVPVYGYVCTLITVSMSETTVYVTVHVPVYQ